MESNGKKWLSPLNLTDDQFANCPPGADPLVWGFEEKVIGEDDYLKWAVEHFQLPRIRSEFFQLAIDKSLSEKYAGLAEWSPANLLWSKSC